LREGGGKKKLPSHYKERGGGGRSSRNLVSRRGAGKKSRRVFMKRKERGFPGEKGGILLLAEKPAAEVWMGGSKQGEALLCAEGGTFGVGKKKNSELATLLERPSPEEGAKGRSLP